MAGCGKGEMGDLWLLEVDVARASAGGFALPPLPAAPARGPWRAADGSQLRVYVESGASLAPPWQRLLCLQEIEGASAGERAACHYVVETDVEPAHERDFNAWYSQEHLPGLAAVPGTVRAARYLRENGSPRYYACYDLVAADVMGCDAWLAVRGTEWSSRVRPRFRNTRRTMFDRLDLRGA